MAKDFAGRFHGAINRGLGFHGVNRAMEIRWDKLDRGEWPDASLQQSWTYGAAMARFGATVARAEILEGVARLGVAQVLRRRFGPLPLSVLNRGPVWHTEPDAGQGLEALRLLSRGVTLATPEAEIAGPLALPILTARHHAVLDLVGGAASMAARMNGKWRNRLRAAGSTGLKVTREKTFGWLVSHEVAQRRDRRYNALPPAFLDAWGSAGGRSLVYAAWKGTERIADMLFLLHPPHATYHLGWSGPEGRASGAHNLILWQAMRDLADEGFVTLDLGAVDTETAPGLARFKIGSGARVGALGRTVLVLPHPGATLGACQGALRNALGVLPVRCWKARVK